MATLEIKEQQSGKVTLLELRGNLRLGEEGVAFRGVIRRLLDEGRRQVLVNFAEVSYIDSSGLGELISSHVSFKKVGGQMKLLHLTQKVRELMIITKLLTVFDVFDNETEALESFDHSEATAAASSVTTAATSASAISRSGL